MIKAWWFCKLRVAGPNKWSCSSGWLCAAPPAMHQLHGAAAPEPRLQAETASGGRSLGWLPGLSVVSPGVGGSAVGEGAAAGRVGAVDW